MKTLVAVMMTALCVFAVATAWVDYVQPQLDLIARATASKAAAEPTAARKRTRKVRIEPLEEDLLPIDEEDLASTAHVTPRRARSLPEKRSQVEETRAFLKDQLEDIKEKESRVTDRQEALEMIYGEIRSELAKLDEIRKQTSEELAEAERIRTAATKRTRQTVASRPNGGTTSTSTRISASSTTGNQNDTAQALMLIKLVDAGKMPTAVSLLKSMNDRTAANVLDSLSKIDHRLANELTDSVTATRDGPIRR